MLKITITAMTTLILCSQAFAYKGDELARRARVTIEQARAIAIKAHLGVVSDEELEREKGGSGLRYSFDIKTAQGTQEVGVDAMSGRLLENAKEGPHPD